MKTIISFLRGINMTGHNSMKMADLSNLVEILGFNDVTTYVQSGNVIFRDPSDMTVKDISNMIKRAILERFDYDIPVIIRTVEDIARIIAANPFIEEANFERSRLMAILLYEPPTKDQIQKVMGIEYPPDKFLIVGSEIFVYCPNGFGKTKLYTNFFEKKMGVTGTARNWKSITTILNIAEKK